MNPVILYDNLLERGTLSSPQGTDPNAPVSMVIDGRPFTRVRFTDPGTWNTIVVELPAAETSDTFALASHNLAAGDIINRYHSDDGTTWTGAGSHIMIGTEDPIIFTTGTSSAHKWWRLAINTAASGNTTPEIGIAMIGNRLEIPQKPETPYTPVDEQIIEEAAHSKTGHLLGSVVRYSKLSINARFKNVDRSFVFGDFKTFWEQHARQRKPFFYAWDLDAFPDQVYYVRHAGRHRTPLSIASLVDQLDLQMEGVL